MCLQVRGDVDVVPDAPAALPELDLRAPAQGVPSQTQGAPSGTRGVALEVYDLLPIHHGRLGLAPGGRQQRHTDVGGSGAVDGRGAGSAEAVVPAAPVQRQRGGLGPDARQVPHEAAVSDQVGVRRLHQGAGATSGGGRCGGRERPRCDIEASADHCAAVLDERDYHRAVRLVCRVWGKLNLHERDSGIHALQAHIQRARCTHARGPGRGGFKQATSPQASTNAHRQHIIAVASGMRQAPITRTSQL
mmetsp:Transcript_125993/g.403386  ORF Transcript_125993/g.403386 Transcript_125993/m.403386 type:complete len:247 (-) Transcript_125993:999-1739(-)